MKCAALLTRFAISFERLWVFDSMQVGSGTVSQVTSLYPSIMTSESIAALKILSQISL